MDYFVSSNSLPPHTVSVLELLCKAGARPDRPEIRLFVTPLVVLVQESRSRNLADHPAALELAEHVTRLWPGFSLCADSAPKTCFLLQCLLLEPIGGVSKTLWEHLKKHGALCGGGLGAAEGAEEQMFWMLESRNTAGVIEMLECGFDPLKWNDGEDQEIGDVRAKDNVVTEKEFLTERCTDISEDTRLDNAPFYRSGMYTVCPLAVAMAHENHRVSVDGRRKLRWGQQGLKIGDFFNIENREVAKVLFFLCGESRDAEFAHFF